MGGRRIASAGVASSCYFRTSVTPGERKALVQITERCNLHCAHCFVSSVREGSDIPLERIRDTVLPQLRQARVSRITLTGGEPFAHPDLIEIVRAARATGMTVTICTNGTLIEAGALEALVDLGGVQVNVSLDGFAASSHGRFRGSPQSFEVTKEMIARLADRGLLKGLLVTPNGLASDGEYEELCRYAAECGAEYVLMNPLASMGRGVRSQRKLAIDERALAKIRDRNVAAVPGELDLVHIRFPNEEAPLAGCEAGTIVYVFASGDVAVCPYLVFAARTPQSRHSADEFLVGNIFSDADIAARLDAYRLHNRRAVRADPTCGTCAMASRCGQGCPAAVIASGGTLGERDRDIRSRG